MGLIRKEDLHESLLNQLSNTNLLINGDFQVWQRGTSFTNIPAAKVIYNVDRWYTNSADSIFNIEKINNGISITRVNNTNRWAHFAQALERNEALKLVGKYVTLTINCTLTTADIIRASIYSGTPSLNSPLSTITLKTGKNIITTKIPDTLDNNDTIGVVFDFIESKVPNSNLQIHYVKLEEGSIATQFVSRPYGEELALCQRYYEYIQRCVGLTNPTMDIVRGQYPFKVAKRIIPNIKYGFGELENVIACVKVSTDEVIKVKPIIDPISNEYGIIIDSRLGITDYTCWEFYAKVEAEIY